MTRFAVDTFALSSVHFLLICTAMAVVKFILPLINCRIIIIQVSYWTQGFVHCDEQNGPMNIVIM